MADWQVIYATDGTGAVTVGNLIDLHNAARLGGDIKVRYSPQPGIWWVRYCASVTVRGAGDRRVVAATYADALDTSDGAGGVIVHEPFALEYHVYNSTGLRSVAKRSPATGDVQTEQRVMPMVWYARDYQLPSLFVRLISLFSSIGRGG